MPVGKYGSGWEINNDTVTYSFTVPFDGEAVFVPDKEITDITLNGDSISFDELVKRTFSKGNYEIKASYRQ
jgi:alpha-L-rhamnosidase